LPPIVFTHEIAHIILARHPYIRAGGLPLAPVNFTVFKIDDEGRSTAANFHDLSVDGVSLNEFTLNDDLPALMEIVGERLRELGYDMDGSAASSFFEEGFCVVLESLFLIYTENEWYAEGISEWIFHHGILDKETGRIYPTQSSIIRMEAYNTAGGFADFEEFRAFTFADDETEIGMIVIEAFASVTDEVPERRATREEIIASIHTRVLTDMANNNFSNTEFFGERYGILNGYFTAGSFIFYLLEYRGSMEDFLKIYSDFSQMADVYGMTMDEMIESWLAYLDTRFSQELLDLHAWQVEYNIRYAEFSLQLSIQFVLEMAELMGWDDELIEMIIESITEQHMQ